jgi:transcriptional regulator with XRE-family HTH domain
MSDQGPVIQRAILVGELVRLRKAKALTQGDVAQRLEWSQAKLMRIEGGRQSVSRSDLLALLREYDVSEEEIERLLSISREANRTAWWDNYRGTGVREDYLKVVGYEYGAVSMVDSQNRLVPGLLQTRDYAEIVTADSVRDKSRVPSIVELRMERQRRINERRSTPLVGTYIIDEAVLRRHIGIKRDPKIMPEQLNHLVNMATSGQAEIRAIPFSEGSHEGLFGPFTLFEFEGDLPDLLYRERPGGEVLAEFGEIVEDHKDITATLLEKALDVGDTVELLRACVEEMSTRVD